MDRESWRVKRVVRREANSPWQIAGAPITAAVEQAADAPENVTQRNAGREYVRHLPERQFFEPDVEDAGECRAHQPAVKNQPALPNHEDFRQRLALKELVPILNHVKRPRSED